MTQHLVSNSPASGLDDWDFCVNSLEEVSRSFTQPILLLPEDQRVALTVGYLLCRVADTVEDCVGVTGTEKDELFSLFQSVLRGSAPSHALSERFENIEVVDTERRLMGGLGQVMAVFDGQKPSIKRATVRWVSEMADGMRLYGRRAEGREFFALMSRQDLERYCYFVAGTVGHLITDLFDEAISQPGLEPQLRKHSESFGLGLQLVNIVKDVTDDFARGVCFLPREFCLEEGFEPEALLEEEHREGAQRVARRVIDRARLHLQGALDYTLTIPAEHHQLRLFCLLPLWMAVETLALAENNDAMFVPGKKIKISRSDVGRIIADCGRDCRNDQALRDAFTAMMNNRADA